MCSFSDGIPICNATIQSGWVCSIQIRMFRIQNSVSSSFCAPSLYTSDESLTTVIESREPHSLPLVTTLGLVPSITVGKTIPMVQQGWWLALMPSQKSSPHSKNKLFVATLSVPLCYSWIYSLSCILTKLMLPLTLQCTVSSCQASIKSSIPTRSGRSTSHFVNLQLTSCQCFLCLTPGLPTRRRQSQHLMLAMSLRKYMIPWWQTEPSWSTSFSGPKSARLVRSLLSPHMLLAVHMKSLRVLLFGFSQVVLSFLTVTSGQCRPWRNCGPHWSSISRDSIRESSLHSKTTPLWVT